MVENNNPKFVVLGGGTGSFALLSGLKHYTSNITALVSMADNGGSTGKLRDELGVLPPGDVRQCLVALSSSPHLRELFTFRFPGNGSLGGHTFGNLFLSAVETMSRDFNEATALAAEVLSITGQVLAITLDDCQLVYQAPDGSLTKGEAAIGSTTMAADRYPNLFYSASARANPKALQAIAGADVVVIAPGSLYTSLVPLLIVDGVAEALEHTSARLVYVANLVNKPSDTADYTVVDYVRALEHYGGGATIDAVLYNTAHAERDIVKRYERDEELPVSSSEKQFKNVNFEPIGGEFLSGSVATIDPNDNTNVQRSYIRHDSDKLARALMRYYFSG